MKYNEQKGVVANVSKFLADANYNIESINTNKDRITNLVTLTVEIDRPLEEKLKDEILNQDRFLESTYVEV